MADRVDAGRGVEKKGALPVGAGSVGCCFVAVFWPVKKLEGGGLFLWRPSLLKR